jgi:hypothetical protein
MAIHGMLRDHGAALDSRHRGYLAGHPDCLRRSRLAQQISMATVIGGPGPDATGEPARDCCLHAVVRLVFSAHPIKPWPLLPAVQGGFTADDFIVDRAAGTVTYPAGITRQVTARNTVIFGVACRAAASRAVHYGQSRPHRAPARARQPPASRPRGPDRGPGTAPGLHGNRPHVERAIAQIATWRGRRLKLRYHGLTRNNAWLKRRTAAVNLRNLPGRGLGRRNGA